MTELSALNVAIKGDDSGLSGAVNSAIKALGGVDKAAKTAKTSVAGVGSASEAAAGDLAKVGTAAAGAASGFDKMKASRAAVDALGASIDPLYAASRKYESAVDTLAKAHAEGAISAREYDMMMGRASAAMLTGAGQASAAGASIAGMGRLSGEARGQIQNFSYQIQDMAVQLQMGTSMTTVLAQQLPQLAGGFGAVGAVVGVLAAVGIPLLGAAFTALSGQTVPLQEQLDALDGQISDLNAALSEAVPESYDAIIEKYGSLNGSVSTNISLIATLQAQLVSLGGIEIGGAFDEAFGRVLVSRMDEIRIAFGATGDEAYRLSSAIDKVGEARGPANQVAALEQVRARIFEITGGTENMTAEQVAYLLQVENAISALNEAKAVLDRMAGVGISGPITAAAAEAARLYSNLSAAQAIQAAMGATGGAASTVEAYGKLPSMYGAPTSSAPTTSARPQAAPALLGETAYAGGGGSKKKAGGGAADKSADELEAFQKSLMSKAELELADYELRQEQLQSFLDKKLISEEQYAAYAQQLQQQHADKMTQIDAYRYGTALDKAGAFLGDMASAMAMGNDKMVKISKVAAAAQALISTYQGAAEELKKGVFGFGSAMAVLAKGAGFIAAIKGVSSSTGTTTAAASSSTSTTSAASSAASSAAASSPLQVSLNTLGGGSLISQLDLSALLKSLNETAGDRGYKIMVPA